MKAGRIVLINGTSSAGKSTLCRALQATLPSPFWHFSSDHFADADMRPQERIDRGEFAWRDMRARFFDGFHRTVPAFAAAGNDMLVEHIIEAPEWAAQLRDLLGGFDVYVVSVRCSSDTLVEREPCRGDRTVGEALYHEKTYGCLEHDLDVDSTHPALENVRIVMHGWQERSVRSGLP